VLTPVKKDSPRMVPDYECLQDERGGPLLGFPYHVPRRVLPKIAERHPLGAVTIASQAQFFDGTTTVLATCGTDAVSEWTLYADTIIDHGTVYLGCAVPSGVVYFADMPDEITMLNQVVAEQPISQPRVAEEEDVVEFRVLPPRVESIASLRGKIKLSKTATDFAREVRTHSFHLENEVEEQSE
jgi:hypothetical protein